MIGVAMASADAKIHSSYKEAHIAYLYKGKTHMA